MEPEQAKMRAPLEAEEVAPPAVVLTPHGNPDEPEQDAKRLFMLEAENQQCMRQSDRGNLARLAAASRTWMRYGGVEAAPGGSAERDAFRARSSQRRAIESTMGWYCNLAREPRAVRRPARWPDPSGQPETRSRITYGQAPPGAGKTDIGWLLAFECAKALHEGMESIDPAHPFRRYLDGGYTKILVATQRTSIRNHTLEVLLGDPTEPARNVLGRIVTPAERAFFRSLICVPTAHAAASVPARIAGALIVVADIQWVQHNAYWLPGNLFALCVLDECDNTSIGAHTIGLFSHFYHAAIHGYSATTEDFVAAFPRVKRSDNKLVQLWQIGEAELVAAGALKQCVLHVVSSHRTGLDMQAAVAQVIRRSSESLGTVFGHCLRLAGEIFAAGCADPRNRAAQHPAAYVPVFPGSWNVASACMVNNVLATLMAVATQLGWDVLVVAKTYQNGVPRENRCAPEELRRRIQAAERFVVVIDVDTIGRGADVPEFCATIYIRTIGNETTYTQVHGRGRRPYGVWPAHEFEQAYNIAAGHGKYIIRRVATGALPASSLRFYSAAEIEHVLSTELSALALTDAERAAADVAQRQNEEQSRVMVNLGNVGNWLRREHALPCVVTVIDSAFGFYAHAFVLEAVTVEGGEFLWRVRFPRAPQECETFAAMTAQQVRDRLVVRLRQWRAMLGLPVPAACQPGAFTALLYLSRTLRASPPALGTSNVVDRCGAMSARLGEWAHLWNDALLSDVRGGPVDRLPVSDQGRLPFGINPDAVPLGVDLLSFVARMPPIVVGDRAFAAPAINLHEFYPSTEWAQLLPGCVDALEPGIVQWARAADRPLAGLIGDVYEAVRRENVFSVAPSALSIGATWESVDLRPLRPISSSFWQRRADDTYRVAAVPLLSPLDGLRGSSPIDINVRLLDLVAAHTPAYRTPAARLASPPREDVDVAAAIEADPETVVDAASVDVPASPPLQGPVVAGKTLRSREKRPPPVHDYSDGEGEDDDAHDPEGRRRKASSSRPAAPPRLATAKPAAMPAPGRAAPAAGDEGPDRVEDDDGPPRRRRRADPDEAEYQPTAEEEQWVADEDRRDAARHPDAAADADDAEVMYGEERVGGGGLLAVLAGAAAASDDAELVVAAVAQRRQGQSPMERYRQLPAPEGLTPFECRRIEAHTRDGGLVHTTSAEPLLIGGVLFRSTKLTDPRTFVQVATGIGLGEINEHGVLHRISRAADPALYLNLTITYGLLTDLIAARGYTTAREVSEAALARDATVCALLSDRHARGLPPPDPANPATTVLETDASDSQKIARNALGRLRQDCIDLSDDNGRYPHPAWYVLVADEYGVAHLPMTLLEEDALVDAVDRLHPSVRIVAWQSWVYGYNAEVARTNRRAVPHTHDMFFYAARDRFRSLLPTLRARVAEMRASVPK